MGFIIKGIKIYDTIWFIRSGRIVKGRVMGKIYGGDVYEVRPLDEPNSLWHLTLQEVFRSRVSAYITLQITKFKGVIYE